MELDVWDLRVILQAMNKKPGTSSEEIKHQAWLYKKLKEEHDKLKMEGELEFDNQLRKKGQDV